MNLTNMFNQHVGITPTLTPRDRREYLHEREGMRMDSGESEEEAVRNTLIDLDRMLGVESKPVSYELDM